MLESKVCTKPLELFSPTSAVGFICCQIINKFPRLELRYQWHCPDFSAVQLGLTEDRRGQYRLDLWHSTCFELFVAHRFNSRYCEWNFALSGEYGFFGFDDYRKQSEDKSLEIPSPLEQKVYAFERQITLQASIDLSKCHLGLKSTDDLMIGISAIVEMKSGSKHFLALKHPGERPDFHLRSSFIAIS
jgi:hypothetical protein